MTADHDVDQLLRAHFEATADPTVLDGQLDRIAAATHRRRQLPGWLASLRSTTMSTTARSLQRPSTATAWALLLIAALLLLVAGLATIGGWRLTPAPIVDGPIVFGRFDPAVDDTVLYVVRPDGSGLQQLLPGAHECPQYSPDGRRIAIGFGVADADGSDLRAFSSRVPGVTLGCSTWSPDGTRLAVEGFNDEGTSANGIFLTNATDGGDATRLTTHGEGGNDVPGDWSPDGSRIAYVHGSSIEENGTLWVVDVADGTKRQVIDDRVDYGPTWSPDGRWIVVDRARSADFIVVRPDGTDRHTLTPPVAADYVGFAQFSPDGTRLLFQMALAGASNADMYTMAVDGTDLVRLTDTPSDNEYFGDWGVDPS